MDFTRLEAQLLVAQNALAHEIQENKKLRARVKELESAVNPLAHPYQAGTDTITYWGELMVITGEVS